LTLKEIITEQQLSKLDKYFSSLIGVGKENITISKVAREINSNPETAALVLNKCCEEGIVNVAYGIRCPECGLQLKRIQEYSSVEGVELDCYGCEHVFVVTDEDIFLLFSLNKYNVSFPDGQHSLACMSIEALSVAPNDVADTLKSFRRFCESGTKKNMLVIEAQEKQEEDAGINSIISRNAFEKLKRNKNIIRLIRLMVWLIEIVIIIYVFKAFENTNYSAIISAITAIGAVFLTSIIPDFISTDMSYLQEKEKQKITRV